MNRRIPIATGLTTFLVILNACQNPQRVAPLGPAAFGSLNVSITAPADVTGANLALPEAQEPGQYAVSGVEVSLVSAEGDLAAALSGPVAARVYTDSKGVASFTALKCDVDYRVLVNVGGGACEQVEKQVRLKAGQTVSCKTVVEKENKTPFAGDIDILENPKVFGIDDTLHFDWEVMNPTGSGVMAEWRVVSANDLGTVLMSGNAPVAAKSNLLRNAIPLSLAGLAATNSPGQSSYKILCVVDGQIVGSDHFVILRDPIQAATPTPVLPTPTPLPPTATPTPRHPVCIESGTDTVIFETGLPAVPVTLLAPDWNAGCSGAPWVSTRADARFVGQHATFGQVVDLPAGNWRATAQVMADDRYLLRLAGQAEQACPDPWCYERCTTFHFEGIVGGGPVTLAIEDLDTGAWYYGVNYSVCFTPVE